MKQATIALLLLAGLALAQPVPHPDPVMPGYPGWSDIEGPQAVNDVGEPVGWIKLPDIEWRGTLWPRVPDWLGGFLFPPQWERPAPLLPPMRPDPNPQPPRGRLLPLRP